MTQHLIDIYRFYATHGMVINRVLTVNDSGYKSMMFACACKTLNLNHVLTVPYTLQTNCTAECIIRKLHREWAYVRAYKSSPQRNMFLEPFLHMYSLHRPHRSINGRSLVGRLYKDYYNLQSSHS